MNYREKEIIKFFASVSSEYFQLVGLKGESRE